MPSQSHLRSLTFVRLLRQWVPTPDEPPRQDVAERLGEWLSAFDSVKLDGALQAIASYGASAQAAPRPRGGPAVDAIRLEALCQGVKAELTALIDLKVAPPDAPEEAAAYPKHLQRYQEAQKQMDARLGACRAQVRQALSKGSPRLRQLAALDGVMADMLGQREQKLLAAVPIYLERRFVHWRQVHEYAQAAMGAATDVDAPQEETQRGLQTGGGWLHGFQRDMRQMLLAELQVRLQPVLGLIEAARDDNRQLDRQQA